MRVPADHVGHDGANAPHQALAQVGRQALRFRQLDGAAQVVAAVRAQRLQRLDGRHRVLCHPGQPIRRHQGCPLRGIVSERGDKLGAGIDHEPVKRAGHAASLVVPPGGVRVRVGVVRNDTPDPGLGIVGGQQVRDRPAHHRVIGGTTKLPQEAQPDPRRQGGRTGRAHVGLQRVPEPAVLVLIRAPTRRARRRRNRPQSDVQKARGPAGGLGLQGIGARDQTLHG